MKNGILYFLKFDRITYAARAVLVIIILSIPKLPKQGAALPLAIVIGAIAVFFSIFHVRSNKFVRNLIKFSEEEFIKDFRRHYELSDNCNIYVTRSFAADDNPRLSHRLDGELIYPHLIFMTYYTMMDRLVLHIRVKSLLRENVEEDFFYEVPKGNVLDIKIEKIDAKIEQVLVKFPDINEKSIPEFPMRLDFHLRDLLKACSCDKYDL